MSDDSDQRFAADTMNGEIDDDAPTERVSGDVAPETDPVHAGVIDSKLAASIRADFAPTIQEEDRITFVGIVDSEGRILVPERIRNSRAIQPGDEILVQAKKLS